MHSVHLGRVFGQLPIDIREMGTTFRYFACNHHVAALVLVLAVVPDHVHSNRNSFMNDGDYGIVFHMDEDIMTTFIQCHEAESPVLVIDLEGALGSGPFIETLPIHHVGSVCHLIVQLLLRVNACSSAERRRRH